MINAKNHKVFFGPNLYSQSPIVVIDIEIDIQTINKVKKACEKINSEFPQWLTNVNKNPQNEILDIANTITNFSFNILNEVRGHIHSYGVIQIDTKARLWLGFHNIYTSLQAIELALNIITTYAQNISTSKDIIEPYLQEFWKLCRMKHPDYQAQILMKAADKLNIPYLPLIDGDNIWQFGWGSRSKIFFESSSNDDGYLGVHLASSKSASKLFMNSLGIPTPQSELANSYESLEEAIKKIGFPCVTKPLDCGGGKGVSANINSLDKLKLGFNEAKRFTNAEIMIEEFIEGDDYRIIVVAGKFDKVFKRTAPIIKGDGKSSVRTLIKELNKNRTSNIVKSNYLRPVLIDNILLSHIEKQNITLETILDKDTFITLRSNANISTGGMCIDCTSLIHPDVKQMAITIALSSGIETIGLDYITSDITKSYNEGKGYFIEFNKTPSLELYTMAGLDSFKSIENILGTKPNRIPFDIIIVKEEELELIQTWLLNSNISHNIGWYCGKNIYLGKTPLIVNQSHDWSSIHTILKQPTIDSILCICTIEDIQNKGMPIDKCDYIYTTEIKIDKDWINVLRENSKEIVLNNQYMDLLLNLNGITYDK